MNSRIVSIFKRSMLPMTVFLVVMLLHFLYLGLFPEQDPAQDQWTTAPIHSVSWVRRYVETQSYWMGISYGVSLAFAAFAFRLYRERRLCSARNFAIGGVTFSGVMSVVGCFLLGCCGSPMLAVYIGLFGTAFVPFAKPLMAAITVLSVLIGWWWMHRRIVFASATTKSRSCESQCSCNSADRAASSPAESRVTS